MRASEETLAKLERMIERTSRIAAGLVAAEEEITNIQRRLEEIHDTQAKNAGFTGPSDDLESAINSPVCLSIRNKRAGDGEE